MKNTNLNNLLLEPTDQANSCLLLTTALVALQAADGILTSMGVSRYGISIEGNPLLRSLMLEFGYITTISCVKIVAVIFVLILGYYARKRPWISGAMGAISCIYFFVAILPWTYILFLSNG